MFLRQPLIANDYFTIITIIGPTISRSNASLISITVCHIVPTEINFVGRAVALVKKWSYILSNHSWTIPNDIQLCQAEKGDIEVELYGT